MAARANWKGFLKIAELTCPVALYTAASSSDRLAFHTVNRQTGHRVQRQFVDKDTGEVVDSADQVKGYEIASGQSVILDPEEIAAAVPESDKTLAVSAFVPCSEMDLVFLDKPYFLAPSDGFGREAYALIQKAMHTSGVAAIARAVLFRRVRTILISAHGSGLMANTLKFDYEVRSAREAFDSVPDMRIAGEMLELGAHIIRTKLGSFEPSKFEDRYEAALAGLVQSKIEGKPIEVRKPRAPGKVLDLMAALRDSAGVSKAAPKPHKLPAKSPAQPKARPTHARRKAS